MSHPSRQPRVTVLMPVRNAAPFLREAIDSLLSQTWRDFHLLILDDGSDDGSGAIMDACAARDPRIGVEHGPPEGLVPTLNHGLDAIDTELIARADADDVNRPDRLARQVAFMDARPDVGVCGSWVEAFPPAALWTMPESADELRAMGLFITPIHNSSAMMRRDWIARSGTRFDPTFIHAEDYEFWERAARITNLANLPAPLVRYRRHPNQVSSQHREQQFASAAAVRHRQLLALGLRPTADELTTHESVSHTRAGVSQERLEAGRRWLERLAEANRSTRHYREPGFTRTLAARWYRNCVEAVLRGHSGAAAFSGSSLAAELPGAWRYLVRLHTLRVFPPRLSRRVAQLAHRLQVR